MYEHNRDSLLYGLVFYAMLTFTANAYLWIIAENNNPALPRTCDALLGAPYLS